MPVFVSVHWTTTLMPDCNPDAGVVARPETARETALNTPKFSPLNVLTAGGGDRDRARAGRGLDVSRLEDRGDAVECPARASLNE